ncbi:hypothetical protein AM593_06940, partial [Mytilus galloprovincialis]
MLNIPKCDSNLDIKQNDKSTRLSEDYYLNSDRAFDSKVILGRIIKYKLLDNIYVSITRGDRMSHNGSSDPMAFIDMMTCDRFNEKNNPEYSRQFLNFFSKELRLPLSRVLIQYHETQIHDYGYIRE